MVVTQVGQQFTTTVNGQDTDIKSGSLSTAIAMTLQRLAEMSEGMVTYPDVDSAVIFERRHDEIKIRKIYVLESFVDEKRLVVKEWDVPTGMTNRVAWEEHPNFKLYGRVMLLGSPSV